MRKTLKATKKKTRAITPVLAILLMIVITVAAALVTYAWVMGYLGFTTGKAGRAMQVQSVHYTNTTDQTLTVYVQNVGEDFVKLGNTSSVYVNGILQTAVITLPGATDDALDVGETATIVVPGVLIPEGDRVRVRVVDDIGTFTEIHTYPLTGGDGGDGGVTPTPPPTVTRVQSEVTGFGSDPTATWDTQPTEGNLLVAISGTRVTGANPVITSAGWTRAHVEASYHTDSSHRRVVAIWYKIAGASESLNVVFNWDVDSGPAWIILQEFTGASSWSFVAADGNDNGFTATSTLDIPLGTVSAGGNDNILAIPGMTFRGEVTTVTFTSENIGNVIKNTEDTDNDGISGFVYTTAGDMDWATTATWTGGPDEATGLLALFSCN